MGFQLKRQPKKIRRLGGVVFNSAENVDAGKEIRRGERVTVFGHFILDGKPFDIAAYFPTRKYWWTLVRNFPTQMSAFLFPGAYLRGKYIDELVQGVRVYDSKSRFVPFNTDLYLRSFRAIRIWIRVYLSPFYPPKPKYFDAKLALVRRVTDVSKRRLNSYTPSKSKEYYIDLVQKADKEMTRYLGTFEKHNKQLQRLSAVFNDVSDNPSNVNMDDLRKKAERFKILLDELALLSEERAKAWPDLEAAKAALRLMQESDENALRKFGPRALLDGLVGVVFGVLSGGSLAIGFMFSVASELGIGFLRHLVLSPRRQADRLMKTAKGYKKAVERVDDFVSLYGLQPRADVYRV